MEVDGDYSLSDGIYEITCEPENFTALAEALEKAEVSVVEANISRIPQNTIEISNLEDAQKIQRLISRLEDHDDVSAVYSNYQFTAEIEEQLDEED